jgi:hypothetical protein
MKNNPSRVKVAGRKEEREMRRNPIPLVLTTLVLLLLAAAPDLKPLPTAGRGPS